MEILESVYKWLFSNSMAVIALISAIIALLAYSHQRKGLRKQNACQVAERYAREMLPRMRYFNKLLQFADLKTVSNKFSGFKAFTEKELNELLLRAESSEQEFRDGFKKLNKNALNKAYAFSGCGNQIYKYHHALIEVAENTPEDLGDAVMRFVKDFLNDLEAMAILLRYNVADEKLIYQSLHQTFLKYMKHLYFYISDENKNDQDRFYANTIWLYNTWNKRKNYDEALIDFVLCVTTKAKKL